MDHIVLLLEEEILLALDVVDGKRTWDFDSGDGGRLSDSQERLRLERRLISINTSIGGKEENRSHIINLFRIRG